MRTIRFRGGRSDEYRALSNFCSSPFVLAGVTWPTVEHYFQSAKGATEKDREYVRKATSPRYARERGRTIKLTPCWDEQKDRVMLFALRAKFKQNPNLAEVLLGTGDAKLVEQAPWDVNSYWGIGRDGRGKNRLGKLLMKVRAELQNDE